LTEPSRQIDYRPILSGLFELAGVAAVTTGCYLLAPWLAFIIGGILLFVVGLAVDPPKKSPKQIVVAE
jgi:ammonia channel protein AmtB